MLRLAWKRTFAGVVLLARMCGLGHPMVGAVALVEGVRPDVSRGVGGDLRRCAARDEFADLAEQFLAAEGAFLEYALDAAAQQQGTVQKQTILLR